MRLIDADALIKRECEADRMGAMLVVGKGYILDAPTIEAAPVVHGKWIKHRSTFDQYEPSTCTCSVCRKNVESINGWNYCPSCGAKIDAEE